MKISINCYLIADIGQMFLDYSSPNTSFLSKPLNLISCHDNRKAIFAKNINKSTHQKL